MNKELIMLMILDGFGISDKTEGNAIKKANTPNLDYLFSKYPNSKINASGEAVGLPEGQMGNSEVGHTNIGAGRIVYQDLMRINNSIKDNSFYDIKEFNDAIDNAISNNTNLHIMGLLSDGGVHSHINHLKALLELCNKRNFDRVYIHAFTDGRDTNPKSGINYIKGLEDKIVSISGRYYAMDRDNRWERIDEAYNAIVLANAKNYNSATEAIEDSYNNGITDEFIKPVIINGGKKINDNDSVIFFNFRPDRARELTKKIIDNLNVYYVCMTEYDSTFDKVNIAFKPEELKNTFGEYISNLGYTQLRIAETEKYAHVTYFFNGGKEETFKNEDRILVPSPKVATYDLMPEMSANIVRDKVIEVIDSDKYNVIILNFANTDMVGHTGNLDATIKAVETIDTAIGMIYKKVLEHNGILIITADHGNAEKMEENGNIFTAHTTNLVPFLITEEGIKLNDGRLCDITPTMLDLMNLDKPIEMTGISLIGDKND